MQHFGRSFALALIVSSGLSLFGQTPTGNIAGVVKDQSGAVVPEAAVTVTNKATGLARNTTAGGDGSYNVSALPAGDYTVRVEMKGFRTQVTDTVVAAGTATTLDAALSLGDAAEVVNVEATAAQVNYESHAVAGVIARTTIQELPLKRPQLFATGEPRAGGDHRGRLRRAIQFAADCNHAGYGWQNAVHD